MRTASFAFSTLSVIKLLYQSNRVIYAEYESANFGIYIVTVERKKKDATYYKVL